MRSSRWGWASRKTDLPSILRAGFIFLEKLTVLLLPYVVVEYYATVCSLPVWRLAHVREVIHADVPSKPVIPSLRPSNVAS